MHAPSIARQRAEIPFRGGCRYVPNVVMIRSERGCDTFGTWLRYVWNVVAIRPERGCDTSGTWLRYVRNVVAIRSERGYDHLGTSLDHVRNVLQPPRNLLEYVPNLLKPPHQRIIIGSERIPTTSLTYSDHLGTYYGGANSPPERLDSHATFAPSIKQDS